VKARFLKELRGALPARAILTEPEDRLCYAYDATRLTHLPDAVALPHSAKEVVAAVRAASAHGIPIVPRGAGSGFSGGSLTVEGGLCLAMSRMNRLLDLDEAEMTATVEPGLVNGLFQEALAARGLFFPPDPSSLDFSTLGGNVAENAGGPRAVKYGVTGDYVLGLEMVLADGETVFLGRRTTKGVVGYDLVSLVVGSEGTLGVVTRITFRLLPLPEAVGTLLAPFPSTAAAIDGVGRLLRSGVAPRTVEFMDRSAVNCIPEERRSNLSAKDAAWLLVEVDGEAGRVAGDLSRVESLLSAAGARGIARATNAAEAEGLWALRRQMSQAINRLGVKKINEDIVVPRTKLATMVERLGAIAAREKVTMVTFGHAGDGNLHVNILLAEGQTEEDPHVARALRAVFDATISLGGTISGEHGVGITKRPFIGLEVPPRALELMRGVKRAFDPKGIMNPGKIFP
jgi:glycolate oxidase